LFKAQLIRSIAKPWALKLLSYFAMRCRPRLLHEIDHLHRERTIGYAQGTGALDRADGDSQYFQKPTVLESS
jgi:hypothetical protein